MAAKKRKRRKNGDAESEGVTEATKGARLRPLKSEVEVEGGSRNEQG